MLFQLSGPSSVTTIKTPQSSLGCGRWTPTQKSGRHTRSHQCESPHQHYPCAVGTREEKLPAWRVPRVDVPSSCQQPLCVFSTHFRVETGPRGKEEVDCVFYVEPKQQASCVTLSLPSLTRGRYFRISSMTKS